MTTVGTGAAAVKSAASASIEMTCPGTGNAIKSVTIVQDGTPDLAGVCIAVPATSLTLPSTKFVVNSKGYPGGDYEAGYVIYTAVPTVTALSVELAPTAAIKLPFLNAVPLIADPAKAATFFAGFAAASGDLAYALTNAFSSMTDKIETQYITISAVFSTQPCMVAGTRSLNIPSDMSTTVALVDFTWNGMYPQGVYMYTGADTSGGGGDYK